MIPQDEEGRRAGQSAPGSASGPADQETQFLDRPSISNYDIVERLGSGGMGTVWLARDQRLGRKVALKLPRAEFTRDQQRLLRFLREARAASALNHPNIITIYEAGESNGLSFVAMEFIEGATVRQLLQGRRMPPGEVLRIIRQIAAALDAAHSAGIIHCDMKPANVMVRPDGLVKVLDFGLAHVEPQPGAAAELETRTGGLMGTPHYMSPEQARGKTVDARSDLFSVSIMMYEMLEGRSPFPGDSQAEVLVALLEREAPPLSDPALDPVVRRALAKNPADRYRSMREFAAALDSAQGSVSTLSQTEPLWIPPSASVLLPAPRTRTRRWLLAVPVAIAAAAVVYQVASRSWSDSVAPETVPFTTFPGAKAYSSFSPDGSQIAFAWDGGRADAGGNRKIYVKLIGVGEPVQLSTGSKDQDASVPVWSPDGRHIAFQRGRSILLIPALPGGQERKIGEGGPGISWSPDGASLAMTSLPKPGEPMAIFIVEVATGRQRRLTQPVRPMTDHSPVFSPDGSSVAFIRTFTSSGRDILTVPVSGGRPRQITSDRRPITGMTWTADSREIVFSSVRTGGRALWRIPARGGTPRRIETSGRNPTFPAISRQGNRLAYTDSWTDTNVYLANGPGFVAGSVPGKFDEPRLLLSSTRDDHSPRISPDGRSIAFVSSRTGSEEIWVSNLDGTAMTQLTHIDGPATGSPNWSPDGRWIAFDTRLAGSADVYLVSADGGEPIRFTTEDSFEGTPVFSRDGNWLYFTSDRGGQGNIWRQRVENGHPRGEPVQVTRKGAFEGVETLDGKLVYSRSSGVYGLWSVPVEGGEEKLFHPRAGYWRAWEILPQGLFYIAREDTPLQTLKFFSFSTGKEIAVNTVPKEPLWFQPSLSISADARVMTLAQRDHETVEILLIEHFR